MVIWNNDSDFDDFYLRFRLTSDEETNYDGIYLDDISLSGINWKFTGNEYGYKSGTSMATPVVAGVAGLVWSVNPGLSCAEVKQILMDSVDLVSGLAGKLISGGRVNAEAAVMSALSFSEPATDPHDVSELVPDVVPEPEPEPGNDTDNDTDNDTELEISDSGDGGGCFIFLLF
jgi:subtilisin family serine protease